jgi:hypothetical protein
VAEELSMTSTQDRLHTCYRCVPVSSSDEGSSGVATLDRLETTFAEGGERVSFVGGYSAREIALRRAREMNGVVFTNNVSLNVKRADTGMLVEYAVARSPVYTVRGPDAAHPHAHRAYWKPL